MWVARIYNKDCMSINVKWTQDRMVWVSGVFSTSTAAEVCFDGLDCFDDLPPWGGTAQRPASVLPWHPEDIGTRFLLFTQQNRHYQARDGFTAQQQLARSFDVSPLMCIWKPCVICLFFVCAFLFILCMALLIGQLQRWQETGWGGD